MYWINFLHIYQPFDQSNEILERVVNESYRPLFRGLLDTKNTKINVNINGALTELFHKKGYRDVIGNIRKLAESGRLEFTESAKYHSLLPFLTEEQIIRQIEKNRETNRKYFGPAYNPVCFFPPEMAYDKKVARVVAKMGYKMILVDELSYNGGKSSPPSDRLLKIKGTNLAAVFRERRVSNAIMSAMVRNSKEFLTLIRDDLEKEKYLCTAMDGETFGHHRPGLEKSLMKIVAKTSRCQIFLSELPDLFNLSGEVDPLPSTWASTTEDIEKKVHFYSWKDPRNKVHQMQWKFIKEVAEAAKKRNLSPNLLEKLDRVMASDQFFWASGEPWWSIEMIEKGSWAMLDFLKMIPGITKKEIERGQKHYNKILSIAFWWQRSGKIESINKKYKESVKIPFKERTIGKGEPEVYWAFIDTMKKKMNQAVREKNFERAILWRDAMWKLETKNDIYDAIHAVDLLRMEVADSELIKLRDKYKEQYDKMRPGQPERRGV